MKLSLLFLSPVLLLASSLWSQSTGMTPSGNLVWSPVPNNPVPSIVDLPSQIGPISQQIKEHPKLADRLQLLLPPGGDLKETCSNFEELSNCVAALHAAANVNIDFWQLSALMNFGALSPREDVPRGTHWMQLKTAIRKLGLPRSNAKAEAKKANAQAKQDMKLSK
ncbi:MAG TPA: hypothetical protein VHW72_18830 [Candidatus Angelobacter sp.]|jgi:hypothetical protein|nr:hypothetical protein [Candidatus Angelobacter sp.]